MTCPRGERNKYNSFKILAPDPESDSTPVAKSLSSMARKGSDSSVEHAFVTINKWIPIKERRRSSTSPSFVVIDNQYHPYGGNKKDPFFVAKNYLLPVLLNIIYHKE